MWQVQDAKAKFSELLETTLREGPQVVTKRGVKTAVLVPFEEWERLKQRARPSLKELLLSDENRFEIKLPPRGSLKLRPVIRFEDE
jgi:prevent-host-death family protein